MTDFFNFLKVKKFVYDAEHDRFVQYKMTLKGFCLKGLKYMGMCLIMALLCYIVFALLFDTDSEKRLAMENRELRKEYEMLMERKAVVEGVISDLEIRDKTIYNDVFKSDPPSFGNAAVDSALIDVSDLYGLAETDIIWDTFAYSNKVESSVDRVCNWIENTNQALQKRGFSPTTIPSIIPIGNFTILQTGASVGSKVNPFYKIIREHTGIDLMAPVGTDVRCTADGYVSDIIKAVTGFGNRIVVTHEGGLQTTYSHLSGILVRKGQRVEQGMIIGRVGVSGTCFAPCLHYEVIRNGEYQEPVNYFFAELSPDMYREMLVVAMTTGQSMD